MKRKSIPDVSPNLPPPQHTHPQTLLKPLVRCGCFPPHATCSLVTDPHFKLAGGRGHHITEVNPSIEDNPYKESHHWPNHYWAPTMCQAKTAARWAWGGDQAHQRWALSWDIFLQGLECPFTCSPPLSVYSQQLPCQRSSLKMDPKGGSSSRLIISVCLWLKGFLGHRMFSVKSGTVLGKP